MPWIYRDVENNITGASKWQNESEQDFITEDSQEWQDYITAEQLKEEAENTRKVEIVNAQNIGDLANVSIDQANAWVLNRLLQAQTSVSAVTDVATAKTAMNQILLAIKDINEKEIPYLLK